MEGKRKKSSNTVQKMTLYNSLNVEIAAKEFFRYFHLSTSLSNWKPQNLA
jgi:hypothetical protein